MGKKYGVGGIILGPNTKKYALEIIESGRLSYGKFLKKFETEFAKDIGVKKAIMTSSGTCALHIAFQMLKEENGWEEGDEIIVPSVTFVASTNVLIHLGLKPVFVDVDPETYNIDPGKIEEKITERTKAIEIVHLFGHPADMDPILEIAKKNNLKIVEDVCESMFATYKGKSLGSFGDVGCFSTYSAHIIATGVGGIITTNNTEEAKILNSLINHGRDPIYLHVDDDDTKDFEKKSEIIDKRYVFNRIGHSFRTTEFEGALGLAQLEIKDEILERRHKNAQMLILELEPFKDRIQLPKVLPYCKHVFMMFPILIKDPKINKKEFVRFLESKDIETRDMLPLINQKPYLKLFGDQSKELPIADNINKRGFYIGCHPELNHTDVKYMSSKIIEFLNNSNSIL